MTKLFKPLSDEQIISRGPAPVKENDKPVSFLAMLIVGGIISAGFAVGAIIGAGMAVAGSMGLVGFISGLATGAIWGGMAGIALLGGACFVGALRERFRETEDRERNRDYEEALKRKRIAETTAGAGKIPEKGQAKKAFSEEKQPAMGVIISTKTPKPTL